MPRISRSFGSAPPLPSLREQARRHPMAVTVLLSLLLHTGGLAILGVGLRTPQTVVAAAEPETADPLRFELIETSESAEVDEPRNSDSRFISNRNTRSQQRSPDPDLPSTGSPRITQEGEGHDLRQVGTAPQRGLPSPPTAPPASPSRASPLSPPSPVQPPREEARPSREPAREPSRVPTGIRVYPEPLPDLPPPERLEETREEERPETREQAARPTPPSPPRPQTRPTPPSPPADEVTPPTAFQLGDRVQPGRPSLSPVEQDLLARAEAEGEISFEATQHFFADYFLRMRRKIENTWVLLLSSRYKSMSPSHASFEFLVLPDGSVAALSPIGAEGDALFPLVCGLSVRNAGPFDPVPYDALPQLPDNVRDLPLRVRVNFNYR